MSSTTNMSSSEIEEKKPEKLSRNPVRRRRQKKHLKKGYEARRQIYINEPARTLEAAGQIHYPTNYVSTTKYTFYNFFFKNLWEQFHRVANIYFVILGIITLTPASPVSPGPYIAVIIMVLAVVMIKDCWEDFQRFKSDRETNRRLSQVLTDEGWVATQWQDLVVGQIIRVEKDQQIPADLILLSTDKPNGQCHVQTINLDGEVNLKIKEALPFTRDHTSIDQLRSLRFMVDAEKPSPHLSKLDCTLVTPDHTFGVSVEQLLVRSTILKNSDFAHGLVLYTGPQTKYMQNCAEPPHKISAMERRLNRYIIYLLIVLVALCILSASLGVAFEFDTANDSWYIADAVTDSGFVYWIILFAAFLVIYGDIIPISLYVTLEMVRLMQGRHMEVDLAMYNPVNGFRAKCLTTTLNEELGQVEYIFSDKTGTLTANKMTMRSCFVNGETYGSVTLKHRADKQEKGGDPNEPTRKRRGTDSLPLIVNGEQGQVKEELEDRFEDPRLLDLVTSRKDPSLIDYFVCICLCNTIFPATSDTGARNYEFESPDELALVKGAAEMGVVLDKKENGVVTINIAGEPHVFQLLHILPFDADRKRMSVVVRFPDDSIRVFIKGADSSMIPIMGSGGGGPQADEDEDEEDHAPKKTAAATGEASQVLESVNEFANNGLRVLVMGQRILSPEEYTEWLQEYWEPMVESFGDQKKEYLQNAIRVLERHVVPIGSSGIEDQLQEGVPETIASLIKANIQIWVLTGDKLETAINIGYSCNLLEPGHKLIVLKTASGGHSKADEEDIGNQIRQNLEEVKNLKDNLMALVVNGTDIPLAISKDNRQAFLELTQLCTSVLVCRATPRDKRKVVRVVKKHLDPLTLAIGDGANDVPMIQEAHIGVGICGEEGTQAVNNSDYAIGQFRFLKKLLLVHGRWNYKRLAFMILYFFYKNIAISVVPLFWAIDNGWSGSAFFDSWTRRGFNIIFTAWPIIIMCVLDQDVYVPGLLKYPQLYIECQEDSSFNRWAFGKWCFWGVYDATLIYYFARLAQFGVTSVFDGTGQTGGGDLLSTTCFTSLVLVCNFRLMFHCRYWTIFHGILFVLSIGLWYVLAIMLSTSMFFSPDLYGVIERLYASAPFWAVNVVTVVACMLPDFIMRAVRREFFPHPFHIIQEATKKKVEQDLRYSKDHSHVCCEPGDWPMRCCRRYCCHCC